MKGIRDVLDACQHSISLHHKLLTSLKSVHDEYASEEAFFDDFLKLLKHSLVCGEKSLAVDRTLEFTARFANYLCPTAGDPEDPEATDIEPQQVHPFFSDLFEFLLDSHDAGSQAVRLHCCQLLNKLLLHLGENAYLEDEMYDRLYKAMLERMLDVSSFVRVQAVFALSRLQEPKNKECPVIKAYQFHLQNDPSADVRRAVLLNIAGTAATLPSVIGRIRDVSAAVRRRAFLFLTKVHIKSISMRERRRLLKEGLQDRDERVREVVQKDLLQFWLRLLKGSPTALLRCLYVELCPEVAEMVVKALCRETSFADMVSSVGLPDDTRLLPVEELTAERALLWRVLCDHLRAEGPDAQLERITPDVPALCQVIEQLAAAELPEEGAERGGADTMSRRFVLTQLVVLAAGLELWDEFGRRALANSVERLLRYDGLDLELVAPLVRLYARAVPAPAARLRALVETISEIRAPLTPTPQPEQEQRPEVVAASVPGEEADRQRRLQRAQLRVKQNELRDRLEAAVAAGDFLTAQQLHEEQARLQEEERQLQRQDTSAAADAAEPDDGEDLGCAERDDPVTLIKCLTLLAELLRTAAPARLPPELGVLVESLVLPSVQREEPAVRQAAATALGVSCLLSRALAEQHLVLFVQMAQVDTWEVQHDALQVVFDLLSVYGLELAEEPEQMAPLVAELTDMLNSPTVEMRGLVAEGLCKLLLFGRITSPRLLERLLLMWYNPALDGDHFLRNMLGVFFPTFGATSRQNQELLSEAMLPTLTTLVQAPMTSPLVEVDGDDVACFFIQLTDSARLPAREAEQPGCIHQDVGYRLLTALLDADTSPLLARLLARALNQLQLTEASTPALRDLASLAAEAIGDGVDPAYGTGVEHAQKKAQLRKFRSAVTALLAMRPEETATPVATPAPRRRRTSGTVQSEEETEDETEVQIAAGLDGSQPSPQRPPPASVVLDTPGGDVTRGEEVFLGASSQDSGEFSACLADESVLSRRGLGPSDAAALKRAAETPPPRARPPAGRLSRRGPAADKRTNLPTGSPAVVPPKKIRQQTSSVSTAPRANVRRARSTRASAPALREPVSPAISEYSSSAVGSELGSPPLAPAAEAEQQASDDGTASPDSVFSTGRRDARTEDTRIVPDTPESDLSAASSRVTRRSAAAGKPAPSDQTTRASRGDTPDTTVSAVSDRTTRASRGDTPDTTVSAASGDTPDTTVSAASDRTTRASRGDTPDSTVSAASDRTMRASRGDTPDTTVSAASDRTTRASHGDTPDSTVSAVASGRTTRASRGDTPDSTVAAVASGRTTRANRGDTPDSTVSSVSTRAARNSRGTANGTAAATAKATAAAPTRRTARRHAQKD